MNILAHRGYWNENISRNSPQALKTAIERGFGIETDVRDYDGELVISHNIADSSCQNAEEVFQWLHGHMDKHCFAINIKADGLKNILKDQLERYNITNYFLFDMSVPQMIEYREIGLRYFTRQSEEEEIPCLYKEATGVWIDGFWSEDWISEELLKTHICNGKYVCIVSPELHGRKGYKDFWRRLRSYTVDFGKVMLCTDHPDEAKEFFYEQKN